jgi:hypothetical protein
MGDRLEAYPLSTGNFHLSICRYIASLATFIPLYLNHYNPFFFFEPTCEKSESAEMGHFKTQPPIYFTEMNELCEIAGVE